MTMLPFGQIGINQFPRSSAFSILISFALSLLMFLSLSTIYNGERIVSAVEPNREAAPPLGNSSQQNAYKIGFASL